ncbi:MAG: cation:proton antiporter [Candidatus Korobacteraceae bacterium]
MIAAAGPVVVEAGAAATVDVAEAVAGADAASRYGTREVDLQNRLIVPRARCSPGSFIYSEQRAMPHESSLIALIAVGLVFAFIGGWIAFRLRLPSMVGYLAAGIVVGPFTPGWTGDTSLALQLAEIGVILLMFGVGMHFSIGDLLAVRGIALPGAVAQIALATALGIGLASLWGWELRPGLVFGLALSVASTVVLLRALEANQLLDTNEGRIAVGWLIVEDLVMVIALVVLPALGTPDSASDRSLWITLALTLGKVAIFITLMLVVGTRLFPWLLKQVENTGSRELFTLAVIAIALGIAFGSAKLFGISFALGAFFAGIVTNASDVSHRAASDSQPLQDAFAALFFVAVGMLFDPKIVVNNPLGVLAVFAIVVFGKSLAAIGIVLILKYPWKTALIVSAALAQIGEFSFILAELGIGLKMLPPEGLSLIVAGALLSITTNPLVFYAAKKLS